jgi:hypothetical protein
VVLGFLGLYGALYLRGLDFGRPILDHHDEWVITGQALTMVAKKQLSPPYLLTYGTLGMYLQCGTCVLTHLYNTARGLYTDAEGHPVPRTLADIAGRDVDRDQFNFYLVGRFSSAVYAGLLFCILYVLCRRVFESRWIAGLCVLAAMTHRLMVQQGHFSLPNVLAVMLGLAAIGLSVEFLRQEKKRFLYLGALVAGLAAGAKVTMGLALTPVLLAALLAPRAGAWKHIPFFVVVCLGGFLLVEPCAVFDYARFKGSMALISAQYGTSAMPDDTVFQRNEFGLDGTQADGPWHPAWYLLLYWLRSGWVFFLVTAMGVAALPFLKGRTGLVLILFPLLYGALVSQQRYVVVRSYPPFVPFWALGFGGTLALLDRVLRNRLGPVRSRSAVIAGGLILAGFAFCAPARTSFAITKQFATTDPLQTAFTWSEANIPPGSKVLVENAWPKQQLPFREGRYQLTRRFGSMFSTPYIELLDQDYVIAQATGMWDRFPWARSAITRGNGVLADCIDRNRRLAEQRLEIVRRVTPEETGYAGPGEFHVNHNVYIYRPPKVAPVRASAKDFAAVPVPGGRRAAGPAVPDAFPVGSSTSAAFHAGLAAGDYDVFLKVAYHSMFPGVIVRVGDEEPQELDVSGCPGNYHFVRTIHVEMPGVVDGSVEIVPGATRQVPLQEVVFVPVSRMSQGMEAGNG